MNHEIELFPEKKSFQDNEKCHFCSNFLKNMIDGTICYVRCSSCSCVICKNCEKEFVTESKCYSCYKRLEKLKQPENLKLCYECVSESFNCEFCNKEICLRDDPSHLAFWKSCTECSLCRLYDNYLIHLCELREKEKFYKSLNLPLSLKFYDLLPSSSCFNLDPECNSLEKWLEECEKWSKSWNSEWKTQWKVCFQPSAPLDHKDISNLIWNYFPEEFHSFFHLKEIFLSSYPLHPSSRSLYLSTSIIGFSFVNLKKVPTSLSQSTLLIFNKRYCLECLPRICSLRSFYSEKEKENNRKNSENENESENESSSSKENENENENDYLENEEEDDDNDDENEQSDDDQQEENDDDEEEKILKQEGQKLCEQACELNSLSQVQEFIKELKNKFILPKTRTCSGTCNLSYFCTSKNITTTTTTTTTTDNDNDDEYHENDNDKNIETIRITKEKENDQEKEEEFIFGNIVPSYFCDNYHTRDCILCGETYCGDCVRSMLFFPEPYNYPLVCVWCAGYLKNLIQTIQKDYSFSSDMSFSSQLENSSCSSEIPKCFLKIRDFFINEAGFKNFLKEAHDEIQKEHMLLLRVNEYNLATIMNNPSIIWLFKKLSPLISKKVEWLYSRKALEWEKQTTQKWRDSSKELKKKWNEWVQEHFCLICKSHLSSFNNTNIQQNNIQQNDNQQSNNKRKRSLL